MKENPPSHKLSGQKQVSRTPDYKVLLVTACGRKKENTRLPAHKLYKSSRIKAVYKRSYGYDMCILSAQYGLIDANEEIEPYDMLMTRDRCQELLPDIRSTIQQYDYILFFKGGAPQIYEDCMISTCESAKKSLVVLGFGNMGGIRDLTTALSLLKQGRIEKIKEISHAKLITLHTIALP